MKSAIAILKTVGIGAAGGIFFLCLLAFFFALTTAVSAALVAFIWNVLALHAVFSLAPLGFWGCVAVGAALNLVLA